MTATHKNLWITTNFVRFGGLSSSFFSVNFSFVSLNQNNWKDKEKKSLIRTKTILMIYRMFLNLFRLYW